MSIYDAFNGRALETDDQCVTLQRYQQLQAKLEKLKRKYAKLQRRHAKLGVKYYQVLLEDD